MDDALSQNLVSSCLIAGAGVAESRRSFSLLFLHNDNEGNYKRDNDNNKDNDKDNDK